MAETQPDLRTQIDWSLSAAKSAEQNCDSGQLQSAADLVERILADDRVTGVMAQRTSMVRFPLAFETVRRSSDGRVIRRASPLAREAIDLLDGEGLFWRMLPVQELRQLIAWGIMFLGLGRMDYTDERGRARMAQTSRGPVNLPLLSYWHPHHLERDIQTRAWKVWVGDGSKQVTIQPGVDGWLLYTPMGAERPWSLGAWRACRLWWQVKQFAISDWSRASELHGMGTFVAKTAKGTPQTERTAFARQLRNLGKERAIAIPDGWDLSLLESSANTFTIFQRQIEFANAGIAVAIAGQNLTSEMTKGGSYAAAEVHRHVVAALIDADASALSDFIREQVLRPWCSVVFGDPDAAPWPVWDSTPPEDDAAKVKTWIDVGDAITKLRSAGLDVDAVAMAQSVHLPLRSERVEDPEPPSAPAAPPSPAPVEPDEDDTEDDDSSDIQARLLRGTVMLASGKRAPAGVVAGQDYADRVTAALADEFRAFLAPHMRQLRTIIEDAETPEDANRAIAAYYADKLRGQAVTGTTDAALQLASIGGVAAVKTDTRT